MNRCLVASVVFLLGVASIAIADRRIDTVYRIDVQLLCEDEIVGWPKILATEGHEFFIDVRGTTKVPKATGSNRELRQGSRVGGMIYRTAGHLYFDGQLSFSTVRDSGSSTAGMRGITVTAELVEPVTLGSPITIPLEIDGMVAKMTITTAK